MKRHFECRDDGDGVGVRGGEMADDLRDVLNALKLCMILCLEYINVGSWKSLELISSNHDGNLHTKICSLLFTEATRYLILMPLGSETIALYQ